MPKYLRSTDGSDADNGTTWALAKASAAGAVSQTASGDVLYVSQDHSESVAGNISLTFNGSAANPARMIGVSDAAEPPTAVSTAPTIAITSGNTAISTTGAAYYVYGINFVAGDGALLVNSINLAASGNAAATFAKCTFNLNSSSNSSQVLLGTSGNARGANVRWQDCAVKFGATGQRVNIASARFRWDGGSVLAGSVTPSAMFKMPSDGEGVDAIISGVDLSALGSTLNIAAITGQTGRFVIRNCKLPASWTGELHSGEPGVACRAEMYNCDSGDTNYRMWIRDYYGSIRSETGIVRAGGASDGATQLSWKMESSIRANALAQPLVSGEIVRWNEVVGSAITVTVEVVHDIASEAAFTDDELWIEVEYQGTSGYPLSKFSSSRIATPLSAAVTVPASSATWNTTGLTTPSKQKMSVTFTPQEAGWISAVVCLGKPSRTVFVDPLLIVS